jgi:O-acetyl-ADP-ribose deacetylase (regulator of RNase III)
MMLRSVDAAVNAANEHLAHGGGIAYAFVRFGGAVVQQESDAHVRQFGALPVAHTAVTGAGRLPAKHIIHVVGPVYDGTPARNDLLRRSILNVLRTARRLCLQSVAIPLVSSGIFGFPKQLAARIIVDAVFEFYNNAADGSQPDESPAGRLPPIEACDLTAAVPFQVDLLDQDVESAKAFETALRDRVEHENSEL